MVPSISNCNFEWTFRWQNLLRTLHSVGRSTGLAPESPTRQSRIQNGNGNGEHEAERSSAKRAWEKTRLGHRGRGLAQRRSRLRGFTECCDSAGPVCGCDEVSANPRRSRSWCGWLMGEGETDARSTDPERTRLRNGRRRRLRDRILRLRVRTLELQQYHAGQMAPQDPVAWAHSTW